MKVSLPRRIWRAVYPALLLFGIYLAVYIIAMLAWNSFFTGRFSSLDEFMAWAGDLVSIIALAAGGIIMYLLYKRDYVVSPLKMFEHPKYIISIILFAVLASHGLSIGVSLVGSTGILGEYTQTAQMLSTSGAVLTLFKSVILVPLAEELTFRGMVFRRMELYTSFWPAALVSAALFGLYHMNLMQGIYAFIFGILMCLVYRTFRNLWATIIMHAVANACAVILQLTGLDYPNITVYVIVMAAALAAAGVIFFVNLRE